MKALRELGAEGVCLPVEAIHPTRGSLPRIILCWRTLADRKQGRETLSQTPYRPEKPCERSQLPSAKLRHPTAIRQAKKVLFLVKL
jgi:hypothetical protein